MTTPLTPTVLCILDGWGIGVSDSHNAIAQANTPIFDTLWTSGNFATSRLAASGEAVGLPAGQIGNSEVGHLNIGAGRVVHQTLPRMNKAFTDDVVGDMEAFESFVSAAKAGSGRVHLMGLASDGGVHAHQDHLLALNRLLMAAGLDVLIHLWSDGRDVAPNAAAEQWPALLQQIDNRQLVSVCGRYFSMDRDNRWDRVEAAFNAMVLGRGDQFTDPLSLLSTQQSDEFIQPSVKVGYEGFQPGDALVCVNFRSDRVREILSAILEPSFDGFHRAAIPEISAALAMTPYSSRLTELCHVLFMPEAINNGLGETIALAGKTQFRLAETEKYPHVTFFLSGGQEAPYSGEDRYVAASPKVATYDLMPEMSAAEVGDTLASLIEARQHHVIICNFANPDMVGHTGDLQAAIMACEVVDQQLGKALRAIGRVSGNMIVTSDHGNCEQMWDPISGGPHTAHTTNPVPVIWAGGPKTAKLANGALCDLAPTILQLAGIEQPSEMTGRSLILD